MTAVVSPQGRLITTAGYRPNRFNIIIVISSLAYLFLPELWPSHSDSPREILWLQFIWSTRLTQLYAKQMVRARSTIRLSVGYKALKDCCDVCRVHILQMSILSNSINCNYSDMNATFPLNKFLSKILVLEPSLGNLGTKNDRIIDRTKRTARKVQWGLQLEKELSELNAAMGP
jgi:hypothetical protein